MARSEARTRMIRGAADLLSRQGLEGTTFAEILAHTGTSRGSIYHHFPGGKDELLLEAVRYVGDGMLKWLATIETGSPAEVVAAFAGVWRRLLVGSDHQSGCSVAAVTMGAGTGELLGAAGTVFASWRDALARQLVAAGMGEPSADHLAVLLIASMEGAVLLARAERDIAPFDVVVDQLVALAESQY